MTKPAKLNHKTTFQSQVTLSLQVRLVPLSTTATYQKMKFWKQTLVSLHPVFN